MCSNKLFEAEREYLQIYSNKGKVPCLIAIWAEVSYKIYEDIFEKDIIRLDRENQSMQLKPDKFRLLMQNVLLMSGIRNKKS